MKKCRTKRCRGSVQPSSKTCWCAKCKHKRRREKYPLRYAYECLRSGAKWRGKEFKLTFEVFSKWAVESGWFNGKGKTRDSLSIDRVDNSKGYEPGNLACITLAWNTRKNFVPYFRQYIEECANPF